MAQRFSNNRKVQKRSRGCCSPRQIKASHRIVLVKKYKEAGSFEIELQLLKHTETLNVLKIDKNYIMHSEIELSKGERHLAISSFGIKNIIYFQSPDKYVIFMPSSFAIKPIVLLLGTEFFVRLAYYGVVFTFASFLQYPLLLSPQKINLVINAFWAMCAVASILFGITADICYRGEVSILRVGAMIYTIALGMLAFSAYFDVFGFQRPGMESLHVAGVSSNHVAVTLFLIGILLFSLGYGAIKTTIGPLLGNMASYIEETSSTAMSSEDSSTDHEKNFSPMTQRLFGIYYWVINAGAFIGILLCPEFCSRADKYWNVCPSQISGLDKSHAESRPVEGIVPCASYWAPYAFCALVSVASLVLTILFRSPKKRLSVDKENLTQISATDAGISAHRVQPLSFHTKFRIIMSILFDTVTRTADKQTPERAMNSPVFELEKRKLIRILTLCAVLPLFWVLANQQSSNYILQANYMARPSWLASPSALNGLNTIILLIVIPLLEIIFAKSAFAHRFSSPKWRIAGGLLLSAIGLAYAAILQWTLDSRGNFDTLGNYELHGNDKLSIWVQVPLYVVQSIAESLTSIIDSSTGLFLGTYNAKIVLHVIIHFYIICRLTGWYDPCTIVDPLTLCVPVFGLRIRNAPRIYLVCCVFLTIICKVRLMMNVQDILGNDFSY